MLSAFRSFRILALATAFGSAALGHASTIIIYNLTGVTTSAGTLTGYVDINAATDLVTSADITFNDSKFNNPEFTNIGSPSVNSYNGIGIDYISGSAGQIALYYDTANIGKSGNLGICISGGACGNPSNPQTSYTQAYLNGGGMFDVTAGSLDPASPTPEPSSLMLLGTGILGAAGLARRRMIA